MKHKCFYLLSEYKAACGNTLISSDDNHLTIYIVSYFERAKRRIHSLHWQMLSGLWFSHWRRLIYTNVFIHTSKTGGLTAQASNAETVRSVASSGVGRCEEKKNHWSKGVTEAELPQQKGVFFRRQNKLHKTPFTCLDMEMFWKGWAIPLEQPSNKTTKFSFAWLPHKM